VIATVESVGTLQRNKGIAAAIAFAHERARIPTPAVGLESELAPGYCCQATERDPT
jgi:hypothetical protein